jgi:3',5'-cyclic-AMP phosphodiesterase
LSRATRQSTDPLRILHITDTHLFADTDRSLRGSVTHSTLQQVLRHFEQSAWRADVVAMTGDVVQDDSRKAYERFCGLMRQLGLPVHCVPGNHDIRPLMREVLDSEPFHYCGFVQRNNWLIVNIDSCAEGIAAGRVADSELDRIDSLIGSSRADHVMVCLHHPPLLVGSAWLDEVGLLDADRFLQRIVASGKVRLLIFGHVHQAFEGAYESVRVIGTPSTCRQFAVASATYAVDDNPPAYRRITLHSDGTIDTDLVWT